MPVADTQLQNLIRPGLRTFPLRSHSIVASQWTGIQHSQCMQLRMLSEQR